METTIEFRATMYADEMNGERDILSDETIGFWDDDYNAYVEIATEQRTVDTKKFKQWFTKWWELNEYLPLDVCLKSIDKEMEE